MTVIIVNLSNLMVDFSELNISCNIFDEYCVTMAIWIKFITQVVVPLRKGKGLKKNSICK